MVERSGTVLRDPDNRDVGQDVAALEFITQQPSIGNCRPLSEAVEMFQADPDLRILPVVDAQDRPIGALFERDMRRILFNPFGHALLRNPSFGSRLDAHVRPSPVVDCATPEQRLIDIYAAQGRGCEGLIVTRGDRYIGLIGGHVLLRLAAEREGQIERSKAERVERIDRASARFRDEASALATDLIAVADQLSVMATGMAERAVQNGQRSADVAVAASQAATNMSEIASRGGELASVFLAIEERLQGAASATREAVDRSARGAAQTRVLAESANEIDDVITLIDDIARTTSMLALNAAIEAARAGDTGRGFAVVAEQVKRLSTQTREAAAKVTARIGHIRAAIAEVSGGQGLMDQAIGTVDALSGSIFDAVARQSAATRAITANVEEASAATGHIHDSADEINRSASIAAEGAENVLAFARTLTGRSRDLQRRVSDFIEAIRVA